MSPANSTGLVRSHFNKMPRAAAITILADTAPPPSLTFLRYICTCVSSSLPSKTGLPRFLRDGAMMSPIIFIQLDCPLYLDSISVRVSQRMNCSFTYKSLELPRIVVGCCSKAIMVGVIAYFSTNMRLLADKAPISASRC